MKIIILIIKTIIFYKIEITIIETIIIIIFYNKDATIIIIFLEMCTIITTMVIIIIDNWIQDSMKTLTQDSSEIEVNHMKIDFYKLITFNEIQIILK